MHNPAIKSLACLVVAAAAIILFQLLSGGQLAVWNNNDIAITQQNQQTLSDSFERTWQRPPTDVEFRFLLDDYVREEMAYRAGSHRKLGRDDVIVRRRIRELLENTAAESIDTEQISSGELQSYLDTHADDFRLDEKLSFRQIYFDVEGNGIAADASARFVLGALQNQDMPEDISEYGDTSLLPAEFTGMQQAEIAVVFGAGFAAQLGGYDIGVWSGPLRSGVGLHLVYIDNRDAGRVPQLSEVEDAVRGALTAERRSAAVDAMYRGLADDFDVDIEAFPEP